MSEIIFMFLIQMKLGCIKLKKCTIKYDVDENIIDITMKCRLRGIELPTI